MIILFYVMFARRRETDLLFSGLNPLAPSESDAAVVQVHAAAGGLWFSSQS